MMNKFFQISDLTSLRSTFGDFRGDSCFMLHINIRSLRKYWDQFKTIAENQEPVVDIFILTEVNVPSTGLSQFNLTGYNAFFRTRQRGRGGGIAVFIRNKWITTDVTVKFDNAESAAFKIQHDSFVVSVLAIYRPPSANVLSFLNELKDNLEELRCEENLCLIGDFNIDSLKSIKSSVCDYMTLLSGYGIECTILSPTREEILNGKLVSSCIDHINIRAPSMSVESAVITQKLADHYFTACRLSSNNSSMNRDSASVNARKGYVQIVDNRKFDYLMSNYDWVNFLNTVNYSNAYSKFVEVVSLFRDKSKRYIYVRQRRSDHVWLTPQILAAIKSRDLLWKRCKNLPKNSFLRSEYVSERNRVNALIRSSKRKHYHNRFFESRFDSRTTWALVNELRNGKHKMSIDEVVEHGFSVDAKVVDSFNEFFVTVSGVCGESILSPINLDRPNVASAYLPLLSEDDLRIILFGFKRNKSPGTDNIRVSDLRRNFDKIKTVLLSMLNGFIANAFIPSELKTSVVRPLYKGGPKGKFESYRPISIIPTVALILEKHLFRVMSSFIDKCNVISPNQYGFVAGRGTQALLDDFSDVLYSTFENNQFACTLFLDVSKAFDSVNHEILLKKLFDGGFRGPFYSLLVNFLSERSQLVSINNICSSKLSLKAGVPQGSILSPLLFNIYVNDLCRVISDCSIYQYADDTVLVSRHINYEKALGMLRSDSMRVMDWFHNNRITINVRKTQLMCFRNPLKPTPINLPFTLHSPKCFLCDCRPLEYVNCTKYIGIYFDSDLSWNSHMSYVAGRLRNVSCLLHSIKVFLPLPIRKLMVNSLAYSVVSYGITVFGNCSGLWKRKIDAILKNILRNVAYNSKFSSSENIFYDMRLPNFDSLFMQTVVLRHCWSSAFKIPRSSGRSLRGTTMFVTPRVFTNYGRSMRAFYIPQIFNHLPHDTLKITSKRKLRNALRDLQDDSS